MTSRQYIRLSITLAALVTSCSSFSFPTYTFTDLGYGSHHYAEAINGEGAMAVNTVYNGAYQALRRLPDGTLQQLPFASVPYVSTGLDISSSQAICGSFQLTSTSVRKGFITFGADMYVIEPQAGAYGETDSVNSNLEAMGMERNPSNGRQLVYYWSPSTGKVVLIGDANLQDVFPNVVKINEAGLAAGYFGNGHAFLYTHASGITQLPLTSNYTSMSADDVSESNMVVGHAASGSAGHIRGWLWTQATGSVDMGDWASYSAINPRAVNSSGFVAGIYGFAGQQLISGGFVWNQSEGYHDLGSLISNLPDGVTVSEISDVNDSGQILAIMQYGSTDVRTALLTPAPEPCTIAGLVIGIGALLKRRQKDQAPMSRR